MERRYKLLRRGGGIGARFVTVGEAAEAGRVRAEWQAPEPTWCGQKGCIRSVHNALHFGRNSLATNLIVIALFCPYFALRDLGGALHMYFFF